MLDMTQLTEYLSREIQPQLTTLEGVQRVEILGGSQMAMRIWLDAERMTALDITPQESSTRCAATTSSPPSARPRARDVQMDLLTDTDLRSPEEFRAARRARGRGVDRPPGRHRDGRAGFRGADHRLRIQRRARRSTSRSGRCRPPTSSRSPASLRAAIQRIEPTLAASVDIRLAYDGTYYMENALEGDLQDPR
jgi:multidrug efflux pump